MANIKSAKKRILVTAKKTMRNKIIKSGVKTSIKKLMVAHQEGNKENAQVALKNAIRSLDKACSKGVFHKNTVSRKKSRLATLINKMN